MDPDRKTAKQKSKTADPIGTAALNSHFKEQGVGDSASRRGHSSGGSDDDVLGQWVRLPLPVEYTAQEEMAAAPARMVKSHVKRVAEDLSIRE